MVRFVRRIWIFSIFMVFFQIYFLTYCEERIIREVANNDKKYINMIKEMDFNRKDFGSSKHNLWYSLTPFEELVLDNIDKAKKGDAISLFSLALFASGDVRTKKEYKKYSMRLNKFLRRIASKVKKEKSDYGKGKIILEEIENEFYNTGKSNGNIKGYTFSQSKLSDIFRTSRYNCVSSSILYLIVARSFNLNVQGINMPSHIFVQLKTQKGKIIEIETTQKTGYDVKHDKKFYSSTGAGWFTRRGLTPCTYEDYLDRKIISPFEVVFLNMNNQHTDLSVMSPFDKNRLLEVMGLIKNDINSQKARLSVYNNEFNYLRKKNDINTMLRMFTIAEPYIVKIYRNSKDPFIQNLTSILLINYIYALIQKNKIDKSEALLITLLKTINPEIKDYNKIIKNSLGIVVRIFNNYLHKKNYSQCEIFLENIKMFFGKESKDIRSCFLFLYEKKAMESWRQDQWKQTIDLFLKALQYSTSLDERNRINKNIQNVFISWYNKYLHKKEYKNCKIILEKCIATLPKCKPCTRNLKKLNRFLFRTDTSTKKKSN